jgi:hypothetical protein
MKLEPIQFLTVPQVGKVIKFDGQSYVLVEHRLDDRKPGRPAGDAKTSKTRLRKGGAK